MEYDHLYNAQFSIKCFKNRRKNVKEFCHKMSIRNRLCFLPACYCYCVTYWLLCKMGLGQLEHPTFTIRKSLRYVTTRIVRKKFYGGERLNVTCNQDRVRYLCLKIGTIWTLYKEKRGFKL